MTDTLFVKNKAILCGIFDSSDKIYWEPFFLLIATLTLIAAVMIPFVQKKNDEYRIKRSFKMYFKKQIGFILNYLTIEKIEYTTIINKESTKEKLDLLEFLKRFENEFKRNKDAEQPMRIYTLLRNLQNLLLFSFQLRHKIKDIDFKDLMKLTLERGDKLSKKELSSIYALIVVLDNFVSISLYHDRFGEIKSIKRLTQKGVWFGLETNKDLVEKQAFLNDDLQFIIENENSIAETAFVLRTVNQKIKEYFDDKK